MIVNDLPLLKRLFEWKATFGTVYYIKIAGSEYIFRPLKKSEYLSMLALQGSMDMDSSDILLSECLLYPEYDIEKFDSKLAGEVDSLVKCIDYVSGFSDTENFAKTMDVVRDSLGTLENQIAILICKAFPQLTLSDINKLTYEDLIRYVAISESILDVKLNIEKPNTKKNGPIDFEKENRDVGGEMSPPVRLITPRGDARKKT